jgi:pimeloyl-ACP methyl ester carboxylesterase
MQRRIFIEALAASASLPQGAGVAMTAPADPALAGVGAHWIGAPALNGGKGYAGCPLGATHYRVLSGGSAQSRHAAPFLLIHQTPFGLAEWVDIQPLLAASGRMVIAPDNPGYGMSDAPTSSLTVAQLADNLIALLDHLGVRKVIVVGHHTGAAIAASFAARHAQRTAAVILHGCPLYTAEERAERLARPARAFEPQADGSHLAQMFKAIHAVSGQRPEALVTATWATLGAYLAGPDTPTYKAVFANDMARDIAGIQAPTLVLTDRADSLHAKDQQVAELRSDFALQEFSDGGSFSLMLAPQRWVAQVTAFVRKKSV